MSRIEDRVCDAIRARADVGKNKYGTTMDRDDLSLLEWIQHAQEEAMDLAVYLEKIKQELHYQDDINKDTVMGSITYDSYGNPCVAHASFSEREEELEGKQFAEYMLAKSEDRKAEERMKAIGQNGNDGVHYDELTYLAGKTTSTLYPGITITYGKTEKKE